MNGWLSKIYYCFRDENPDNCPLYQSNRYHRQFWLAESILSFTFSSRSTFIIYFLVHTRTLHMPLPSTVMHFSSKALFRNDESHFSDSWTETKFVEKQPEREFYSVKCLEDKFCKLIIGFFSALNTVLMIIVTQTFHKNCLNKTKIIVENF